ncbi:MAG: ABC transporter permease [Bacillota bacterium]
MSLRKVSISFAVLTLMFYLILVFSLLSFISKDRFFDILFSERTLFSIKLSITAAFVAVMLSFIIALPSAYGLSRYEFVGKKFIDLILELPMIVSPAALGAILLIFFYNNMGTWIQEHVLQFVFTFYGIILAQFTTILGVTIRMIKSGFDEISPRYENTARTLGANSFQAFRSVSLPLCSKSILATLIFAWAKAVGEFGATITVAGTMAMRTETLPVAIYMRLSVADIDGAVVLITILLSIGLLVLFIVRQVIGGKSNASN